MDALQPWGRISARGVAKGTYDEVDVLCIRVPLEFERELFEIPNAHLWFVCPCGNSMVSIARRFYSAARLGELEVLDELDGTFGTAKLKERAIDWLGGAIRVPCV